MEWMLLPLKRYADFSGRSRRREYWMFLLLKVLIFIPLFVLMISSVMIGRGDNVGPLFLPALALYLLFALLMLVPTLAVQARRFHDQGHSAWMVLLNLVPSIGGLVVLVFMCLEGQRGANTYGADPKQLA